MEQPGADMKEMFIFVPLSSIYVRSVINPSTPSAWNRGGGGGGAGVESLQIIRRLSLGHLQPNVHLLRRKCRQQFSDCLKAATEDKSSSVWNICYHSVPGSLNIRHLKLHRSTFLQKSKIKNRSKHQVQCKSFCSLGQTTHWLHSWPLILLRTLLFSLFGFDDSHCFHQLSYTGCFLSKSSDKATLHFTPNINQRCQN